MQIKTIFFTFFVSLPLIAGAQALQKGNEYNDQKIAMLDESSVLDKVIINSTNKKVNSDELIPENDNIVLPKDLQNNSFIGRFKPVPLIGEINYYNPRTNGELIQYSTSYISNFGNGLSRVRQKTKIFQTIESILSRHHIPKELEYLAVIESALNSNAKSPVGAVGYWQFMDFTGRQMGLVVSNRRDERTDLYKSTEAAAKYLTYLYDRLGDWLLVVGAYNCGPGRVEQAIARAGGAKDFWAIKRFLPYETQNHVMAFVATATIMERLQDYMLTGIPKNFDWSSLDYDSSPEAVRLAAIKSRNDYLDKHPLVKRFGTHEVGKMALVRINSPLSLSILATVLNMDINVVNRWNYDYSDYQKNFKAGDTYNLRIPKDKLDQFLAQRNYIQTASQKTALN